MMNKVIFVCKKDGCVFKLLNISISSQEQMCGHHVRSGLWVRIQRGGEVKGREKGEGEKRGEEGRKGKKKRQGGERRGAKKMRGQKNKRRAEERKEEDGSGEKKRGACV